MRTMKYIIPAALLLVTLAIACNRGEHKQYFRNMVSQDRKPEEVNEHGGLSDTVAVPVNEGIPTHAGHPQSESNPDWDKKIVKTADLIVETRNFRDYTERLHQKVKAAGGYIASEEQHATDYKIENTITIRVPVDRFDETVMRMASDSEKLVSKKVSSEDVTMQLIDTRSHLETKKEVRLRYLELLKQAHSMKDILQVQGEIDELQEQMDGATGRIAYLSHAAAYSTINLNFYQILNPTVKEDAEPSFLHQLGDAIKTGWYWVSVLFIGLVGLWPLIAGSVLGAFWWRRRRHQKRATAEALAVSQK